MKAHQPITGQEIADILNLSRAALRSDLSILIKLSILDARPKVGYFYLGEKDFELQKSNFSDIPVSKVMRQPSIVKDKDSINDAVVKLFMDNTSSLFVTDSEDNLCGVVSRKDILKATLGRPEVQSVPVSMVMTRQPNIFTISADKTVAEAVHLLAQKQVDSLPVVSESNGRTTVIGKFTKTLVLQLFAEILPKKL